MPSNGNTPRQRTEPPHAVGRASFEAEGFGTLGLLWSDKGLVRLTFPGEVPLGGTNVPVAPLPPDWLKLLESYFRGDPVDPAEIPVDLHGTAFQLKVWNALRKVPRGKVRTYQGIASDIGSPRAMRAVGTANGKNPIPIVVPCHRVVEHGNHLGGYSAGIARKIKLLELEGVKVEGDLVRPGQLGLL